MIKTAAPSAAENSSSCIAATRQIGRAAIAMLALLFLGAAVTDSFANECRPKRPLRPVTLKTMGPCQFDPESTTFAGSAVQQTACLIRPVGELGHLGPVREHLPPVLATRVGRPNDLPMREILSGFLSKRNLEWDFAAYLWQPVSRGNDGDPKAPPARYFVIHDSSGPNFGRKPFPTDINTSWFVNNLGRHRCVDGWERAHVTINRRGVMLRGHDFAQPWRATKFERATQFGRNLRGLFLHVEMVQPRRSKKRRGRGNDVVAPSPGFTKAQYDSLALTYVIASVRADVWLIPAFHAVLDTDIYNGHDDPQNFELDKFAASLKTLIDQLKPHDKSIAASVPETRVVSD